MSDAYEREQYVQVPPFGAVAIFPDRLLGRRQFASCSVAMPLNCLLLTLALRQNNALLNSLSSKVSALRSVTIDIHDNARDQDTLDHSVR